jgi:hypothetical protein
MREIHLEAERECPLEQYVGRFPKPDDYDEVLSEDCDVFVSGRKVAAFRKKVVPVLSSGSEKEPEAWQFFRKASREVYGTQRGIVAGSVYTSRPDTRLTQGQAAFFHQSSLGLITTREQAEEILSSSNELTTKTIKIKWVKRAFPEIKELCTPLEKVLRDKGTPEVELLKVREKRREALWKWFDPWLSEVWGPSEDKAEVTKKAISDFISTQQNFNHCYSNVLGAVDRGSRFPYGRLSGSTQRHYPEFDLYRNIYSSVNSSYREEFPVEWEKANEIVSGVREPAYNLFGTAFTSITLNFSFQTAFHLDKNNLKGSLAALTVFTKGSYGGHFLVFPQLRLAFDVRDGDLIIADTQRLLHGNTEMEKYSEDAERISLVFYSREKVARLEDLECESCRRDFLRFSMENLTVRGKGHKDWTGVWPGMWYSQEWADFKAERGLKRCSNSNWRLSSPYQNQQSGEVRIFDQHPGQPWIPVEVTSELQDG